MRARCRMPATGGWPIRRESNRRSGPEDTPTHGGSAPSGYITVGPTADQVLREGRVPPSSGSPRRNRLDFTPASTINVTGASVLQSRIAGLSTRPRTTPPHSSGAPMTSIPKSGTSPSASGGCFQTLATDLDAPPRDPPPIHGGANAPRRRQRRAPASDGNLRRSRPSRDVGHHGPLGAERRQPIVQRGHHVTSQPAAGPRPCRRDHRWPGSGQSSPPPTPSSGWPA